MYTDINYFTLCEYKTFDSGGTPIVADRSHSTRHWPVVFNQWDLGNSCRMLLHASFVCNFWSKLDRFIIPSVKCERSKIGIVDLARNGRTDSSRMTAQLGELHKVVGSVLIRARCSNLEQNTSSPLLSTG